MRLQTGQCKERLARLADDFRDPAAGRDLEQLDRRRGGRVDLSHLGLDTDGLARLVADGALAGVQHLDLRGNRLDADAIAVLSAATGLDDLRWLQLSDNPLGSDGLWTLLQAPWTAALRELALRRCGIDHEGVLALGEDTRARALTRLDLSHNPLGTAGGCALARAHLPQLRHLGLTHTALGPDVGRALAGARDLDALSTLILDDNPLGTEGLATLLAGDTCHHLGALSVRGVGLDDVVEVSASLAALSGRLRHLDVSHNRLGDDGLTALLCALGSTPLASLRAAAVRLGQRGAHALADAPALASLRRLDLADNGLREDALSPVLSAPWLVGLRELELGGNPVGGRALAASMASLGSLPRLGRLAVPRMQLGSSGLDALLDAVALPALLELEAGGEWLGGSAGAAIAERLPRLRRLHLGGAQISSGGVRLLFASSALRNLVELDLSANAIGDTGAAVLADAALRHVRILRLAHNALGPRGLRTLLGSRTVAGVTHLDLAGNPLGRGGTTALAETTRQAHLEHLDLSCCSLDTEAAHALAAAHHLTGLRSLVLNGNLIGDPGLERLLGSPLVDALHTLSLGGCGLGDRAARLLGAATERLPRLTALDLSRNTLSGAGVCALWRAPHLQHMRVLELDLGLIDPTLCIELLADRTLPVDTRRAAASLLTGAQLRTAARRCRVEHCEAMGRYELVRAVVGD